MTALIPIEPGQWVLAYVEHFGPSPGDGDLIAALERLTRGGSGWDCLRQASDQFDLLQVDRVMPKTFRSPDGRRVWRNLIVAAAGTSGELIALRDRLFAIGFAADRAIEEETARLIAPFAAKTRADALEKIRTALPHVFGRQA